MQQSEINTELTPLNDDMPPRTWSDRHVLRKPRGPRELRRLARVTKLIAKRSNDPDAIRDAELADRCLKLAMAGQAVPPEYKQAMGEAAVARAMAILDEGVGRTHKPGEQAMLASTIATLHKALNPQDRKAPQVQINILSDGESARRALANLGVISDAGEVIDVEAEQGDASHD